MTDNLSMVTDIYWYLVIYFCTVNKENGHTVYTYKCKYLHSNREIAHMIFHLCLHIVCVDVSFVIITGWKLQTGTNIHKKTCIKFCHAGTNSWKSQCIWMLNSILAQINQKDPPSPTTKLHIHRRETSFSYIPTSSLIVHFFFSLAYM